MNLEPFLNHFDGVRRIYDQQYIAKCPAHDDRSPSLSIKDAGNRILIHCFAGCLNGEVLQAIGLTFADLYENPKSGSNWTGPRFPKPDILACDRLVIEMAKTALAAGETLPLEDKVRVEEALIRLGGSHHG